MPPDDLICGSLLSTGDWPLCVQVQLCDLRPRFIPKARVGQGYRAIARNGRVVLASDHPMEDLLGQTARLRVQTWHKAILPAEAPQIHGVLMCVRLAPSAAGQPRFKARLARKQDEPCALRIDLGGGMALKLDP
jgi:hypothetical protein